MRYLLLAVTIAIFFCEYLADLHLLPSGARFVPELLSIVVIVCVLVLGIKQRFRLVRPAYWLIMGSVVIVIVCGIIANAVEPGPMLGGMRFYLRAIPLFFVPAVVEFDAEEIGKQLRLILALALLQVPISIYQRYAIFAADKYSGDDVFGTVMISGNLSIFLIGVVAVLTGMYLRKRISLTTYVILFFVLLMPTTINETKATVFLLPLGLMGALMIGSPGRRVRMAVIALSLLASFGAIFVPIYDYFNMTHNREGFTLERFFTDKRLNAAYLNGNATLGTRKEAGRVDAITIPLELMSEDPVQLMFGLGLGNVTYSSLGQQFTGKYASLYSRYAIESSIATFLLEIGLAGVILVLGLQWLVWRDSLFVAQVDNGILGAFAIGWAATTMVMVVSLFYLTMHAFESASYLSWYFSGLMAATRMRYSLAVSEPTGLPRQVGQQ